MSDTRCSVGGRSWLAAVVGGMLAAAPVAWAGPNDGEGRSILRDGDRVYDVVAGEADAAAVVTNPAGLGHLRGISAVLDVAWTAKTARRRGSGVGAFVGIPLPLRVAALGFGYQFFYPVQRADGSTIGASPQQVDETYSKFTLALAIPLAFWTRNLTSARWLTRLSLGINYSRLVSSSNFHANGVNQTDLGISWWASRFLALAVVARAMNVPHTGPPDALGQQPTAQSFVLDPELAVRPLGTPLLEVAVGLRWAPRVEDELFRFRTFHFEPRGRLMIGPPRARFFATAERFRYFPFQQAGERDAVRVGLGVEVNFGRFGFAGSLLASGNTRQAFAAAGGAGRLRFSQERYDGIKVTPRLVTQIKLAKYAGDRGLWELIAELDRVARRSGDVLVETRGMSLGWAQVEELREALLRVRQGGGKVFAYLEGGSLRHYFLATAANRVVAHPNQSLSIVGLRIEAFYYADLLERLGATAEFVRIAEYKAYPEAFERTTASRPAARQRKQMVGDIWNHALRVLARDRGHDPQVVKAWIDDAPIHPPRAERQGVVDALAFPDELDAKLEQWLGRKVRIAPAPRERQHEHAFGPTPRIAVLMIEGDLFDSESFEIPLLGRKVAGSYTLTKQIEALRADPGVRALVVRIDSPGGSVSAADAIARELDLTRETKPVVISMSNTCASGGYYIATAGQYMFADATTMTGSIGIFYPKIDLSGMFEKFGIGIDEFNFGRHAGLRSWFRPYTDSDRSAALQDIQDAYVTFTKRVAAARSMSLAQVDKVARGRVWSGVRADEVGLVDEHGGLREAIMRARAMAALQPAEDDVVVFPEKPGVIENLRRMFGTDLPLPLGRQRTTAGANALGVGLGGLGGLGIPAPLLVVLRRLPASLWLLDSPRPLALGEDAIIVRD